MRIRDGRTIIMGDTYEVVKAEHAKLGYKFEWWTLNYWLLYEVNGDKATVHLFTSHVEMLSYMESKKDDFEVRFEIVQERKVLSEARKVTKEQLLMFMDTDGDEPK